MLHLEESVTSDGGKFHWSRDADEANEIIGRIVKDHGSDEVVKVKSIATDETKLTEIVMERIQSALDDRFL